MSYNALLEKRDSGEDEDVTSERRFGELLCHACQRQGRIRRRLWFLSPLFFALILALLALNIRQTYTVKDAVARDVDRRVYGHDRDYMSLDHQYDHLWEPPREKGGTVMLPLYPGGEEVVGTVGMFHSLHCLASFRKALQRASAGEKIGINDLDNGHWPHCFHYVRQAIHCAADGTVERLRFQNGSLGAPSITGQWDVRKCGNSDKLYEFDRTHAACGREDGTYGRCEHQ